LFLQDDVEPGVREMLSKTIQTTADGLDANLRRFAHVVVTLPEFNLA
jgi:hypothetical protein